ncbi:CoA transferase [Catenulispora sp. NL8]|uniref:CoA transferase n=1 Tax=Catenulispora pinistramenti TaxID=2705254 RepID=A0ABS5L720_9ACTN|nr:CoA transferase [Catenulispora pinistramenti]MBS2554153.1 CoA transferase [Catenulispora pinistramenti]
MTAVHCAADRSVPDPEVGLDADPADAGPLAGLLVIDLTRVLAGPFATMIMADLGARVIKVENPSGGDDSRRYGPFAADGRSMYFARVNRGKQSLAVDLKKDAEQVAALAERADVLVENFRPGVMDRLGLGPAALRARNPRLVYASVSGYGATGPRSGEPAYDAVIQARSGLMSVTGEPDGPPVKSGASVSDLSAGVYTFGAVMAALVGRGIHGRGTHIDIAMFDATVSFLEGNALAWLADRTVPHRIGPHHPNIAPFGAFAAADGQIVVCVGNDALFVAFAAALGAPRLAEDPLFAQNAARSANRLVLTAVIEELLAADTCVNWLARLEAAKVPCAPVNDIGQAMTDEQTEARRMRITAGGLELPGQVVKMAGYPDPAVRPAAPGLDEHGDAIRAEFGL